MLCSTPSNVLVNDTLYPDKGTRCVPFYGLINRNSLNKARGWGEGNEPIRIKLSHHPCQI
jgi:hypothetical protein